MQIGESVHISLNAIRSNKMRSALTLLGIIIGVMTIIAMQSLVTGLRKSLNEQISMLGSNVFQVQKYPAINTGHNRQKYRNRKDLGMKEYLAIRDYVDAARQVGAEYWQSGEELRYEDKKTLPDIHLCGGNTAFLENNSFAMAEGRFLSQQDMDYNRSVVVIGSDIANTLFPYQSPLDQDIKIRGQRFKVMGVFAERGGTMGGGNHNKYAVIPVGAFLKVYGKERSMNITVQAKSEAHYQQAIEQTIGVLRTVRKVPPGEENDFSIYSNETLIDFFDNMTKYVRIAAIVIASISLLVAGVGIMNIMLVSVTERTREIGIRKSIGAKRRDVLWQFLIEAIVLSEVGGVVGILMGLGIAKLVALISPVPAAVPVWTVVLGLLFCSAVGLLFGVYPATKAARLDPITALRYE